MDLIPVLNGFKIVSLKCLDAIFVRTLLQGEECQRHRPVCWRFIEVDIVTLDVGDERCKIELR